MSEILIPHTFAARRFAVSVDRAAPDLAHIHFDIDGRQQYSFSLSRRQLIRLFSAMGRALKEAPRVRRRTKASSTDAMAQRRRGERVWPPSTGRMIACRPNCITPHNGDAPNPLVVSKVHLHSLV